MKTKYKVEDKVRVIGEKETGRIINIGYSERMAEAIYIVEFKDCKRKVLEHQIQPAEVVITEKEFDMAVNAVLDGYFVTAISKDMDETQVEKLMEIVGDVCSDLKGALFDGM